MPLSRRCAPPVLRSSSDLTYPEELEAAKGDPDGGEHPGVGNVEVGEHVLTLVVLVGLTVVRVVGARETVGGGSL